MTTRKETPDILGPERQRIDVLDAVLDGRHPAPAQPQPEPIPVDRIRADGGTQMRAQLDDATVFEYAQAMIEAGSWGTFPAAVVFYDGSTYWLGDGFHRVAAFREAFSGGSHLTVPCDVRAGDRRAAILYAAGANALHGLRRTNHDKRRSVQTLIRDEEWAAWSDREIARACNVSHTLVAQLRAHLTVNIASEKSEERTYTTKHGTQASMKTAAIGKGKPATPPLPASPEQRQYDMEVVAPVTFPPAKPATTPAGTLPANLAARGWELKRVADVGRFYCYNANGPRSTQPHDSPEEAIQVAYGMQVDLMAPAAQTGERAANIASARSALNQAINLMTAAMSRIRGDDDRHAAEIQAAIQNVQRIVGELQ